MKTITYKIPGISCMHCVHTIKSELIELEGVKSVEARPDIKEATVVFEDPATDAKVRALLAEIQYPAA